MVTTFSPLSFPPDTFAVLSPSSHLLAHLQPTSSSQPPTRPSGRSPSTPRQPVITTDSLINSNGSAVVRLGDTAVVCAVRAEILRAQDIPHQKQNAKPPDQRCDIESLGLLITNVELSTGCSPDHLPGNAPGPVAQSLTHRLHKLLHATKPLPETIFRITVSETDEDGEVKEVVKAYWALYIDVLVMSHDGNPFDTIWLAAFAALRNTHLPSARWEADLERVVCDPHKTLQNRVKTLGRPVACSTAVFSTESKLRGEPGKRWFLVDPDACEEKVCDEIITIVVSGDGRILGIEKSGGGKIGIEDMDELIQEANRRASEWGGILTSPEHVS